MNFALRVLMAIAGLAVLTVYFFADLVLVEPSATSGSAANPTSTVLTREDGLISNESINPLIEGQIPRVSGVPGNSAFQPSILRGITGTSGGMISSFKESWQRLYSRWPVGKKIFRKSGTLTGSYSTVMRDRIGNLLTFISIAVGLGAISLAINFVDQKARG